jgi:glycosyltransferase involved in cell wall biosynthesis
MLQPPLHLLCIEPRFPGRLGAVADWLVRRRGYRVRFVFSSAEPRDHWPESVGKGLDLMACPVSGEGAVEWVRYLERGLGHALAYFEGLEKHRLRPIDLVLGRSSGLGSTLFVPVHLPGVPIVNLFDYFYHPHRHDLAGEAGPQTPLAYFHWRRSANAMDLIDLENGLTPWTPTRWQRDLYPPEYRDDFLVLHDGVNVERFRRSSAPRFIAGRNVPAQTRVVTFVARALDRVRGFDRFHALANRLLRARSDVVCVVVGSPVVQRGLDVEFFNKDYRAHVLSQTPLHDPERMWFLDQTTADVVAGVLTASDLHVYPGRPYPVSRSLLEAMAAGCVILAADTEPVREFVCHGQTGLLVAPEDSDAWQRQALAVLDNPAEHRPLGEAAAEWVRQHCSQDVTLPVLAERFTELVNGRAFAPVRR